MAEKNGNGNGNGESNGNGNGKGNEEGKSPDFTQLNAGLESLPTKIQAAVQEGVITALNAVKDENTQSQRRQAAKDRDDDVDVETMSNQELATHITKQVVGSVSELLKPVHKRVSNVQTATEEDRIRAEAIAIAEVDPCFIEMRNEMAEVAKTHPDLSVRDIYTLAKVNNPDKFEKVQKAFKEKDEKDKDESGEKPAAFGGFLPSSGVKSSGKDAGKMNSKDAANAAFDEVFKDIPAHVISGEDA